MFFLPSLLFLCEQLPTSVPSTYPNQPRRTSTDQLPCQYPESEKRHEFNSRTMTFKAIFTNPQNDIARSACPIPAGNLRVQFREVSLHDGLLEVLQASSPRQFVAHPLKVVPGEHLLVHVVKEFAPAVLLHDFGRPRERVNQVPMPVVKIDAQILSEVRQPVLCLPVCGGVVTRNFDKSLSNKNPVFNSELFDEFSTII